MRRGTNKAENRDDVGCGVGHAADGGAWVRRCRIPASDVAGWGSASALACARRQPRPGDRRSLVGAGRAGDLRHRPYRWCGVPGGDAPRAHRLRSVSSGGRCTRTRPRSPASHTRCCASSHSDMNRSPNGSTTRASRGPAAAAVAQRATRTRKQTPADFAAVEADWHARAEAARLGASRPRAAPGLSSSFRRARRVRDRGRVVARRCPIGDDTARRVRRVARLAARSSGHGPRRDVHPVRSDPSRRVGAPGIDIGGGRRGHRAAGAGITGGGTAR